MTGPFFVYAYYDARGRVLYVGMTRDLAARHRSHKARPRASWFSKQVRREVLSRHGLRQHAFLAEEDAIKALRPIHNVDRPGARRAA